MSKLQIHNVSILDFKKAILLSAEIREKSWIESWEPFKSKYGLDLMQSSEKAITQLELSKEFIYPVYLLLEIAWNDILDWSKEQ